MALLGRHKERAEQRRASRHWLDSDSRFLCGKYGPKDGEPGHSAELVAVICPHYIRWVLENVDNISEEDKKILTALLKYKSRNESEDD